MNRIETYTSSLFFKHIPAAHDGFAKQLKAENQMEWVGRMNNIRSRAKEVINNELIFS